MEPGQFLIIVVGLVNAVQTQTIGRVPVLGEGICTGYQKLEENCVNSDSCRWNYGPNSPYCQCPPLFSFTICNDVQLHEGRPLEVPSKNSPYKYLTFINSDIPIIPVGTFTHLPNISELYLNNTGVESIDYAAFVGLGHLRQLHLDNNNLKDIRSGMFSYFPTLQLLDLSANNIQTVADDSLKGLRNLSELYISNNHISSLAGTSFTSLNQLKVLDLSRNQLDTCSFEKYDTNSSTEITQCNSLIIPDSVVNLNVSHNHVNVKNSSLVLPHAEYVDLSKNNISYIRIVSDEIRWLDLSWNKLTVVDDFLLLSSQKLTVINASHNDIRDIGPSSFDSFPNLIVLELQHNSLQKIPVGLFASLRQLRSLDLSQNRLSHFDFGTFTGLGGLQYLNLSTNQLQADFTTSLVVLKNLNKLDVSFNSIDYINTAHVSKNMKQFSYIFLDGNPWECNILATVLHELTRFNINVVSGSTKKTSNLDGVACENSSGENNYSFANQSLDSTSSDTTSKILGRLDKLIEINLLLKSSLSNSTTSLVSAIRSGYKNDSSGMFNSSLYKQLVLDNGKDDINGRFLKELNSSIHSLTSAIIASTNTFGQTNRELYQKIQNMVNHYSLNISSTVVPLNNNLIQPSDADKSFKSTPYEDKTNLLLSQLVDAISANHQENKVHVKEDDSSGVVDSVYLTFSLFVNLSVLVLLVVTVTIYLRKMFSYGVVSNGGCSEGQLELV